GERAALAEKAVGRELNAEQVDAVRQAREVVAPEPAAEPAKAGEKGGDFGQLREQVVILKKAGFTPAEIRSLMKEGVVETPAAAAAARGAAPAIESRVAAERGGAAEVRTPVEAPTLAEAEAFDPSLEPLEVAASPEPAARVRAARPTYTSR